MEENINSTKRNARLAGLIYFLLVVTGMFGIMYVSTQTFVNGDSAATAEKIIANEFLFRAGIVSQLISQTLYVFLVLALYRLLKEVNEHQAKLMVALVITAVPIAFVIEAFKFAALMILKGEVLTTLELSQKQDFAIFFLKLNSYGISILKIFWGLWLIPFGQLVYKSGFMPRILGVFLILGGLAFVIESFTYLLFPDYRSVVNQFTYIFYTIAELSIVFWLLIIGVRTPKLTKAQ